MAIESTDDSTTFKFPPPRQVIEGGQSEETSRDAYGSLPYPNRPSAALIGGSMASTGLIGGLLGINRARSMHTLGPPVAARMGIAGMSKTAKAGIGSAPPLLAMAMNAATGSYEDQISEEMIARLSHPSEDIIGTGPHHVTPEEARDIAMRMGISNQSGSLQSLIQNTGEIGASFHPLTGIGAGVTELAKGSGNLRMGPLIEQSIRDFASARRQYNLTDKAKAKSLGMVLKEPEGPKAIFKTPDETGMGIWDRLLRPFREDELKHPPLNKPKNTQTY